jgi:hypothetical protein
VNIEGVKRSEFHVWRVSSSVYLHRDLWSIKPNYRREEKENDLESIHFMHCNI